MTNSFLSFSVALLAVLRASVGLVMNSFRERPTGSCVKEIGARHADSGSGDSEASSSQRNGGSIATQACALVMQEGANGLEVERRGWEADRSAMNVGSVVVLFASQLARTGNKAKDAGSKANTIECSAIVSGSWVETSERVAIRCGSMFRRQTAFPMDRQRCSLRSSESCFLPFRFLAFRDAGPP